VSVRRLAPLQPESFAFNRENLSWAKATIKKYPEGKQASAVIPLLWRAQEQNNGWISRPAMEYVADMLGMPYIRVYEVATFYTMFQLSPVGKKAHIQVCGTTPCMLRGAEDLKKVCQRKIHHDPHHLSADGNFSWEEVECLGACVNAPMVQIWKDTYEDLTPETLEKLIDDIAAGREVKPGPQNGRQFSAPQGKLTSLTDKSLYGRERTDKRSDDDPPPPQTAAQPPAVTPAEAVTLAAPAPATPRRAEQPAAPRAAKQAGAEPKPELLKKPRTGKGDDLKLIWGIGPALEKMLNRMGVWHFDQIASWSARELAWVDERLEGFKGRAKRDQWVKQAKKLAKGWRPESAVGEKPGGK
jgi:NADH-quinone oxidoreductase subunit E